MVTIQSKGNPGSRRDVGDGVIERAKTATTTAVRKQLAAFAAIHRAYVAKDDAARKVDAALRAAQAKVADADVAQDRAVEALASARIGDGAKRTKPFAGLGFPPPSEITSLGYEKEAKVVAKLAAAATKAAGAGAKTKQAARAATTAAAAVTAAQRPVAALRKASFAALAQRDALGQEWETKLLHLKHAARAADDDGSRGLFAKLFDVPRVATKPRKGKPAPQPVVTPPTNGGGAVAS